VTVTKCFEIDLTNLNAPTKRRELSPAYLLDQFLHQEEKKIKKPSFWTQVFGWFTGHPSKTFPANKIYTVTLPHYQEPISFTLKQNLTYTPLFVKSVKRRLPAYIVTNPEEVKIGEGVRGRVLQTIGTLIRSNGILTFKDKKTYVDKVQDHAFIFNTISAIREEARALKKMHSGARPIVVEGTAPFNRRTHIVDEKFGVNLTTLIGETNGHSLSRREKLHISIQFLREIQKIHAHGYYHHDLTTNNVLYDRRTGEVKVIDFGSAKKQNAFFQSGGKKQFVAPEKFSYLFRRIDHHADIYSAGLVLAKLWFNTERRPFAFKTDFFATLKMLLSFIFTRKEEFSTPLPTIENLEDVIEKAVLCEIQNKMLPLIPGERHSLEKLIKKFESFELNASNQSSPEFFEAVESASNLRDQLVKIEATKPTLFGPKKKTHLDALLQMQKLITSHLSELGKSNAELSKFLSVAGFKHAFSGLTTKEGCIKRTDDIVNKFQQHSFQLVNLYNQYAGKATILSHDPRFKSSEHLRSFKHQIDELCYLINKIESSHLHLDDLMKINKACQKKLPEILKNLKRLEEHVDFGSSSSAYHIFSVLSTNYEPGSLSTELKNNVRNALRQQLLLDHNPESPNNKDHIHQFLEKMDKKVVQNETDFKDFIKENLGIFSEREKPLRKAVEKAVGLKV